LTLADHFIRAKTVSQRQVEYSAVYEGLENLANARGIAERSVPSLFDAAFGFRLRNQRQRERADVSQLVANRDLKSLVDRGMLVPKVESRKAKGEGGTTSLWTSRWPFERSIGSRRRSPTHSIDRAKSPGCPFQLAIV